jgi:hypothetical protein
MDGERFDRVARLFAHGVTRRGTLSLVIGAVAGVASTAVAGRVEAKATCRGVRCAHACCGGHCCGDAGDVCTDAGKCCPAKQTCGDHCCPPENVGCTEIVLPDGSVKIGCLCPQGTVPVRHACIPCHKDGTTCAADVQCCSGSCCNGHCCPADQFCVDGVCGCAAGTGCSGSATCIGPEHTYTTEGTCCQMPLVAECCNDGPRGSPAGFARCCTPGVDCLDGTFCPNGGFHALGGAVGVCFGATGGDSIFLDCIGGQTTCSPTFPCCSGLPCGRDGTCHCLSIGAACGSGWVPGEFQCCTGRCEDGVCACIPANEIACVTDADCCAGLVCNHTFGTCQPPSG